MLLVQFIGVAPCSAGGSPNKKFCRGNVNAAKSNFVTPYEVWTQATQFQGWSANIAKTLQPFNVCVISKSG